MTHAVHHGDCREVMATLDAESVDAVVCDPPYGLSFMGKKWDSFNGVCVECGNDDALDGFSCCSDCLPKIGDKARLCKSHGGKSMLGHISKNWHDKGTHSRGYADNDNAAFQAWCNNWAREALRVAKPGAHLLAFGGTRTYHRLACAIEDAGWEIRDCVMWVYGSGFPKSHDVSKAIDKAAGAEREKIGPRVYAGGHVQNHSGVAHGGSYCGFDHSGTTMQDAPATDAARQWSGWGTALKPAWEPIIVARKPLCGTVAENVLKHGTGGINVDGCRVGTDGGTCRDGKADKPNDSGWENMRGHGIATLAAGRWPANLIHDGSDEVVGLFPDTASGSRKAGRHVIAGGQGRYGLFAEGELPEIVGDSGSAARFFYCAKASKADRGDDNGHPTVKPTALMRYLCRLVTPPGGVVLDPFTGSGSTGKAAILEGFDFVGIEREAEYVEIARARIAAAVRDRPLLEATA